MSWEDFVDVSENIKVDCLNRVSKHKPLFKEIVRGSPDTILEVGCGTGQMSYFLSRYLNSEVTGIDKEEEIIRKLKEIEGPRNLNFRRINALSLSEELSQNYDICFHQGLLEHFGNNKIEKLIDEQLKISQKIIFSVPSYYYKDKDYGNERLLKKSSWEEILQDYDIDCTYYGQRSPHLVRNAKKGNIRYIIDSIMNEGRPQLLFSIK